MRTRLWCVALALSCGSVPGAAQTVLSEADALARLSIESPRIRAIRSAIGVAEAELLSAGRWPNPRVTVDRESVAGIKEVITMVAQPLPITGRRGFEMSAASALVAAATSRTDDETRRAGRTCDWRLPIWWPPRPRARAGAHPRPAAGACGGAWQARGGRRRGWLRSSSCRTRGAGARSGSRGHGSDRARAQATLRLSSRGRSIRRASSRQASGRARACHRSTR